LDTKQNNSENKSVPQGKCSHRDIYASNLPGGFIGDNRCAGLSRGLASRGWNLICALLFSWDWVREC